jgi:hypothetical protein
MATKKKAKKSKSETSVNETVLNAIQVLKDRKAFLDREEKKYSLEFERLEKEFKDIKQEIRGLVEKELRPKFESKYKFVKPYFSDQKYRVLFDIKDFSSSYLAYLYLDTNDISGQIYGGNLRATCVVEEKDSYHDALKLSLPLREWIDIEKLNCIKEIEKNYLKLESVAKKYKENRVKYGEVSTALSFAEG